MSTLDDVIYLRSVHFTQAVLDTAVKLNHPLAQYHSCSSREIEASLRAIIQAAEDAESEYIALVKERNKEHKKHSTVNAMKSLNAIEVDMAVGLILPIPGVKDYVLICGAYLGQAEDETLKPIPQFKSTRMTIFKLHSLSSWLVPTRVVKGHPISDTSVRIEGLNGSEVLQVVRLPPTRKFKLHNLKCCEFKEYVPKALVVMLGFRRLYQPELFFREDKDFPNQTVSRTPRTVANSENHEESEFVQAHLMPSYMNLLSCTLKFVKAITKSLKAKGLYKEDISDKLQWTTEHTESVLRHFYKLYDSFALDCGQIGSEGQRALFDSELLSRDNSFERILANALHHRDEHASGEFAKFRRLCPETGLFNLKKEDISAFTHNRNKFNKGISLITIYGELSVTAKRDGNFEVKAKPTLELETETGYKLIPVEIHKSGVKVEVFQKNCKNDSSTDIFPAREKALETLATINELQGYTGETEVASVGIFSSVDLLDAIDEKYQSMLDAFWLINRELSSYDHRKLKPLIPA